MTHLQLSVDRWPEPYKKLSGLNGILFKSVDQGSENIVVRSIYSGFNTCLRHWYDGKQIFGGTHEENKQRAREFFNTFIDGTFIKQYAPHTNFVEEWNEYIATGEPEMDKRIAWARAAAEVWYQEYRFKNWVVDDVNYGQPLSHIRLVLCNTAVGNWIPRDFAVIARDWGCAMGYHPYTHWQMIDGVPVRAANDWADLSGLFDRMEKSWGIFLDWVFTEAGTFQSATDGWRSAKCLDGNVDYLIQAMAEWIEDVKTTDAYKENRIVGFATFTVNRNVDQYASYRLFYPELDRIADLILAEWKPGTAPPATTPEWNPTHWPTDYKHINQAFGVNPDYYMQFGLPGHEGIDIRAYYGSNIYFASDAEVYEVVNVNDGHNYGCRVRARSGKHRHIYSHMISGSIQVKVGDVVKAGDFVGKADTTGNATGSHLHLTLKHDDAYPGGPRYINYPYNIIDPTPYLEPLLDSCRGKPREQYGRVVHVIAPGTSLDRQMFIWRVAEENKQTVGWSYDDAGIGDLDRRMAILWDLPENIRDSYRGWYDKYYPGVVVEFRE